LLHEPIKGMFYVEFRAALIFGGALPKVSHRRHQKN
jgi:hypothetical protein